MLTLTLYVCVSVLMGACNGIGAVEVYTMATEIKARPLSTLTEEAFITATLPHAIRLREEGSHFKTSRILAKTAISCTFSFNSLSPYEAVVFGAGQPYCSEYQEDQLIRKLNLTRFDTLTEGE